MTITTITAYILAAIFLVLCAIAMYRAVPKVLHNLKVKKQIRYYEKNRAEMRKKGLKEYSFNKGKTKVWATNFKEANLHYQTSRRNGKSNI
ncbi:hypothetical protein RM553_12770 [Zunongwangia sp. F363]|uniref:ATP synthase F0 subunit 8 n=1 Tax=Autumnicola tepida TaxID=3075595 RepID=A0ABU3CBR5_9FLAO|nr:hypothetical protein [Zunongwangia sp. F363]MDT0643708.1 hypothetical protein [Zunongwangia sp. F363]